MSTVSEPVVAAGINPIDLTAWKVRLARREQKAQEPDPIAETESQHDKEWETWYLKMTDEKPLLTTDQLRAMAVETGRKIAPGTIEIHDRYINEHDGKEHAAIIRAFRQFAIFGLWSDGSKNGPALPAVGINKLKQLAAHGMFTKYLKWMRSVDMAGFLKWVETNESYRTQGGAVAMAERPATVSPSN